MRIRLAIILAVWALAGAGTGMAADKLPDLPEAAPEPEITITTKGEERHEEYRINGRLYMVKVTPKIGPPYYLVDEEGEGRFRQTLKDPGVVIPRWVLFRF